MKKIVSLILAAAMLLACSVCFAEGETVMHVGTNPEFSPFEYVDDNGEIAGIDVDIMNEIGKDLGVTIEMQAMEFDALVPSLASGKLDATIAGMSITDERKQSVLFSDPYVTSTQVVILAEGSEIATADDLKGKKIGVPGLADAATVVSKRSLSAAGIGVTDQNMEVEFSVYSRNDLAQALQNGAVDAIALGDPAASTATIITEKEYVSGDVDFCAQILKTYNYKPSVQGGYDALKQNAEELTKIGILKEGTDATKFADNAYIFFDDVPDAPESDASTDTATKSTKGSSVSFQPAAAAEAEDDCCSGKITKPAQDTNAKA